MYGQTCSGLWILHVLYIRNVYRHIGPRRPKVELALFVIICLSISASGERGRSVPRSTRPGDQFYDKKRTRRHARASM